ncbi:MAG: helix-turn-helix domain-containing protein [Lachnospiraceae bacterium]|nr:helix-turn-helix domain-containing protein [Lachnospiraceae bacterium]
MDAALCYEKTDEEKREERQKEQRKTRQEKKDRGLAIAKLLLEKNIKNKEVAAWLGWKDPHQVSRLKAGTADISIDEACILRDHLGVPIEFFCLSTYEKKEDPSGESTDESFRARPPDEDMNDEDMELMPAEELTPEQSKIVLEFRRCAFRLLKLADEETVPVGFIEKYLNTMKGLAKSMEPVVRYMESEKIHS